MLDGELVASDADGKPDFPQLCECVLMQRESAPLTFVAFDLLSIEGRNVMSLPYHERRAMLEELGLNGPYWCTPEAFDAGTARPWSSTTGRATHSKPRRRTTSSFATRSLRRPQVLSPSEWVRLFGKGA